MRGFVRVFTELGEPVRLSRDYRPRSPNGSVRTFPRQGGRAMLLALGMSLAGCSSMIDHIPTSLGGLPEGVPARPQVQPAYPAVHDMPQQRPETPLTDAERK